MEVDREQLERLIAHVKEKAELDQQTLSRGPEFCGMELDEWNKACNELEDLALTIQQLEHRVRAEEREQQQREHKTRIVAGYLTRWNSVWDLINRYVPVEQVFADVLEIAEKVEEEGGKEEYDSYLQQLEQIGREFEDKKGSLIYR